jgi:hypothetical protein
MPFHERYPEPAPPAKKAVSKVVAKAVKTKTEQKRVADASAVRVAQEALYAPPGTTKPKPLPNRPAWMNDHVVEPYALKSASVTPSLSPDEYLHVCFDDLPDRVLETQLDAVVKAIEPDTIKTKGRTSHLLEPMKPLDGRNLADVLDDFEIPGISTKDPTRSVHWTILARLIAPNRSRREILLRTVIQLVALTVNSVKQDLSGAIDGEAAYDFDMGTLAESVAETYPSELPDDPLGLAHQVAALSPNERAAFQRHLDTLPKSR